MAPEQAAGRARRRARRPLRARRSCSTRRSRASTRSAPARRPRPRAAIGTVLAAARAARAPTCPAELCAAIDRALLPDPEERGDARRPGRRARRRAAARSPTRAARSRRTRSSARLPALPPAVGRLRGARRGRRAGLGRARRADAASPRSPPPLAAAVAARARRAAAARSAGWSPPPRRGRCSTFGPAPRPGAALLVAALALAPPLLLRADGRAWSLPAAAPLLGLVGLAGAYPALAGRAPRWSARAALGALGAWWLAARRAAARPRRSCSARRPGTPARAGFDGAPGIAAGDVIAPLVQLRRAAARRALGASPRSCCRGSCAAARSPADIVARRVLGGRRWRPRRRRSASGSATARAAGAARLRGRRGRRRRALAVALARRPAPPGAGAVTADAATAHRDHAAACDRVARAMSVLRNLESKLAGLVEGTFSRAFKSEVRPVEIARKLAREMDEHQVQSLSPHLRAERVRRLALARGPRAVRGLRGRAARASCRATCSSTRAASGSRC